ncbi:MAG: hypothetical protein KatS3mg115_1970 [Candidatus Poribacteria bacterium]|nr:MAG: hypothetical protein KatS3mg115_1970 [Candidatus Poribacteria bacterium]
MDERGRLTDALRIAGGPEESIFQPEWAPDGSLLFVSDRTGWWNLYRWDGEQIHPLAPMKAEFGLPQWQFGMRTYAVAEDGTLYALCGQSGRWQLIRLSLDGGEPEPIPLPFTQLSDPLLLEGDLYLFAASPTEPWALIRYRPASSRWEVLRRSRENVPDRRYLSVPEPIAYPTTEGETAYGLYYPPTNPEYRAPTGELPPLIVTTHGGPTAAASDAFNLSIQYWTSRGFAVLDVNYRGEHRLRSSVPVSTVREVGSLRRGRLRLWRALSGRAGESRPSSFDRPWRQRWRLHDVGCAHLPRDFSRGRQLLWDRRSSRVG